MANRRFRDRAGETWEVRERSRTEWVLEPVLENPGTRRSVRPPSYEPDPFELTDQELQRQLDESGAGSVAPRPPRKSPFLDD
jgi:hypothetical protein